MKKSYLLEGYRFIVAITIVFFHVWGYTVDTAGITNNWRLGVEFFYILSGFLLMKHCEEHVEETALRLFFEKWKQFYPYILVMFLAGAIEIAYSEGEKIVVVCYRYFSMLLLMSNALRGKAEQMRCLGHLWFIVSQLYATYILSYLIKKHSKAYRSILAVLLMVGCYCMSIRCNDNLTTNQFLKIGDAKIYIPLLLVRALAGMSCGTLLYMIYKNIGGYSYTKLARTFGIGASVFCQLAGIWLSKRSLDDAVNSFGWRALLVVLLYAMAIVLAFSFADGFPESAILKKILSTLGRWSMLIYFVHQTVIFALNDLKISYGLKFFVLVFLTTAIGCVALDMCVKGIRKIESQIVRKIKAA